MADGLGVFTAKRASYIKKKTKTNKKSTIARRPYFENTTVPYLWVLRSLVQSNRPKIFEGVENVTQK